MDKSECYALLDRLNCPAHVIRHSEAVALLAQEIASRIAECSIETVYAGSLLHDIGRTVTHTIAHAYEGDKIALRYGLPDTIREIIRTHIGGGITAAEALILGLPEQDFMPVSIESKIVSHADNLISDTIRRSLAETLDNYTEKGLHTAVERIQILHNEISERAGVDVDTLAISRLNGERGSRNAE